MFAVVKLVGKFRVPCVDAHVDQSPSGNDNELPLDRQRGKSHHRVWNNVQEWQRCTLMFEVMTSDKLPEKNRSAFEAACKTAWKSHIRSNRKNKIRNRVQRLIQCTVLWWYSSVLALGSHYAVSHLKCNLNQCSLPLMRTLVLTRLLAWRSGIC